MSVLAPLKSIGQPGDLNSLNLFDLLILANVISFTAMVHQGLTYEKRHEKADVCIFAPQCDCWFNA